MALRNTIDLGSLNAPGSDGKPLDIPLDDIGEDPDQPRTDFDQDELQELADDITERGVLQPISVYLNPDSGPRYLINFGARRYRASKIAKKETIPGFVDEKLDDYAQVAENEKRSNLKPMELALFIHRKVTAGTSKAEVARKLGKGGDAITIHLALIDMPEHIGAAFREGRIVDPRAVYEMRNLAKAHPAEVEQLCVQESVKASTVKALARELSRLADEPAADTNVPSSAPEKPTSPAKPKPPAKPRPQPPERQRMVVIIDDRQADVRFDILPSIHGRMSVQYHDDEVIEEVACGRCTVHGLYEGRS